MEDYLNRLGGTKAGDSRPSLCFPRPCFWQGYGGKMETGKENPYSCVVLAGMRNQASASDGKSLRFQALYDIYADGALGAPKHWGQSDQHNAFLVVIFKLPSSTVMWPAN